MSSIQINALNPAKVPAAVTAKQLAGEVVCRKCGYKLLGLRLASRCPDCGTPVGSSVHGDLLRFANPAWLRTLRGGTILVFWQVGVVLVAFIAGFALVAHQPELMKVATSFGILPALIGMVAIWKLTTPDPSGAGESQYGISRRIARITIFADLAASILFWVRHSVVLSPDAGVKLVIASVVADGCRIISNVVLLYYLAKLARRIPDESLTDEAHFLMVAIGITESLVAALSVPLMIAAVKSPGAEPPSNVTPLGCFGSLAFVALAIFAIHYVRLLNELRKSFENQAVAADLIDAPTAPLANSPA